MDLYRQLADCIKLMDTSSVSYLRVKGEDFEFTLSKSAISEAASIRADAEQPVARDRPSDSPVFANPTAAPTAPGHLPQETARANSGAGTDPDLQVVRAPLLGTFYCSPEPGAPPFVTVGDNVTAGTTIGLLEAMKMFTAVPAGVDGKIERIVASDGELVEFDMPIALIRAQ